MIKASAIINLTLGILAPPLARKQMSVLPGSLLPCSVYYPIQNASEKFIILSRIASGLLFHRYAKE